MSARSHRLSAEGTWAGSRTVVLTLGFLVLVSAGCGEGRGWLADQLGRGRGKGHHDDYRDAHVRSDAGTQDPPGHAADPERLIGDRRIPFAPPNDVKLTDFFIPHHLMAIRMAEIEIARGTREEVRALAEEIKADQEVELAVMREIRHELTGRADPDPPPPADPHMEADRAAMEASTGPEVDRMFLQHMIPHHAAGLPVAHRADPRMKREDSHFLAQHFFDAQANEIGTMKRLLGESAPCRPTGGPPDCPTEADIRVVGDRRVPFTPADDVAFIDFFIMHHEEAIEMAMLEVERGRREDVKAMAQRIITEQMEEIDHMRAIREELTGRAEPDQHPKDPHAERDMELMHRLSENALDDLFLREMIQHHASGLTAAHRSEPRLERDDLRQLAHAIFNAQAEEIGEIQMLRFRT